MANIIAIDIGGSTTKGAVITPSKELPRAPRIILETDQHNGSQGVLDQVFQIIEDLISSHHIQREENIISISVPGLVDSKNGMVQLALNLPAFVQIPLAQIIKDNTQYPVIVENDANCAALGEWYYVYKSQPKSLVFITISTGIGAGIIIDSQLYRGSTDFAGEFGHMSVDIDGPLCHECNKSRGCLTTLCSGTGITNYVKQNFNPDEDVLIASFCNNMPEDIDSVCIEKAAGQGDKLSLRTYERAGTALGQGLVNVIHMLDPELLILGGGVLNAADFLLPSVQQILGERLLDPSKKNIIKRSSLGNLQGIAGAGINAFQSFSVK
jgi:glucokinase